MTTDDSLVNYVLLMWSRDELGPEGLTGFVDLEGAGKCLARVFFYNSHRVKSSLLSSELSFRSLLQGRQTSK